MKQDLIEALKMLARGRIDAAETVADLLMPEKAKFSEFSGFGAGKGERITGPVQVYEDSPLYAVEVPEAPTNLAEFAEVMAVPAKKAKAK